MDFNLVDSHMHLLSWDMVTRDYMTDRGVKIPLFSSVPLLQDILSHPKLVDSLVAAYNFFAPRNVYPQQIAFEFVNPWIVGIRRQLEDYQKAGVDAICLLNIDFYGSDPFWSIEEKWGLLRLVKKMAEKRGIHCFTFLGIDPARPGAGKLLDKWLPTADGVKLYLPLSDCTQSQLVSVCECVQHYGKLTTTHCSPGGAGQNEDKAHPDFFYPVLQKWPWYRVNFAHMGGGDKGYEESCELNLLEYENTRADWSFHSGFKLHPERYTDKLQSYFDLDDPDAPAIGEKLMWGTDRLLTSVFYSLLENIDWHKENLQPNQWQSFKTDSFCSWAEPARGAIK